MVGKPVPESMARELGCPTSEVSAEGWTCPSSKQQGKCGDCRQCWSRDVATVVYKTH